MALKPMKRSFEKIAATEMAAISPLRGIGEKGQSHSGQTVLDRQHFPN
jgi:hypothetical protein